MTKENEMPLPKVRRFEEQRWLIDAVIRTVGAEWDQARIASKARPVGGEFEALFRATAQRVKKLDDIEREFSAQAKRQQERAQALEAEGRSVAARETYMAAGLMWSLAAWPILEICDALHHADAQMNACFAGLIRHAPRPIERVEIPFRPKSLPAYLHLPRKPAAGERFATVLAVGGMDSSKENLVSLYGDKLIERGFAVLAMDGPGQAESAGRGIHFSPEAWMEAAEVAYRWIAARPELDEGRLVLRGISFGSYFGSVMSATLGDRIKGFAASGVCQEPGCDTIFNKASPTFKARFMFMSGFTDEAEFDVFADCIDLRPLAKRIVAPYMVVAGENDQLSPLDHTEQLMGLIPAPRRLVVYEGANHGVGDAPSVTLGEDKFTLMADWLLDRVAGKPARSERVFIEASGRARVEALG
jgi:pimeloyl-ACP methyl ester carboxylesterase